MSNKQPKRRKSYAENLSIEVTNIIDETKKDMEQEFPSLYLTPHLFFLTALDIEGCFIREVLSKFLKEEKVKRIYDKLRDIVESETLSVVKPGTKIEYSESFINLLIKAQKYSKSQKQTTTTSDHILISFCIEELKKNNDKDPFYTILIEEGVTLGKLKNGSEALSQETNSLSDVLSSLFGNNLLTNSNVSVSIIGDDGMGNMEEMFPVKNKKEKNNQASLDYCTEMVSKMRKEKDFFLGRESIISNIVGILAKKIQNNVILVGESGVGKSALIKHIAKQITDKNSEIHNLGINKLYNFNLNEMMEGTQFRGVFEGRANNFISDLSEEKDAAIVIEDIQDSISSESRSENITYILSGLLKNDTNKIIVTATPKGYKVLSDKYKSLAKRFQKITIEPSSIDETQAILEHIKKEYEQFHNVIYPNNFAKTCASLSNRYLNGMALPLSAINLMDITGAEKRLKNIKKNTAETDKMIQDADIFSAVSKMSNIPVSKINISEKQTLKDIDGSLRKIVVGQDEAIEKICRIIKRNKIGLSSPNKPIGSFLCIGNTGCGKTLMAKTIAKEIFGDEKNLIRFDMSEYSDDTSVNKLIGSSAGYVGYNEGGLLTEAVKNKKYAVVLIDEIEKANDKVFNLFLQMLDEGVLTDNMGDKVDFKNTIIIMTSNIGVKDALLNRGIGFSVDDNQNRKSIIEKNLKNKFAPEFLNRIDEIIYFNDLTDENYKAIIGLELDKIIEQLKSIGYNGEYGEATVNAIFKIIIKEKEYGARPIVRAIQDKIENAITDLLLEKEYAKNYKFNFDKII